MTKIKTNLVNYCISHKYFSYLDKLNFHVIGSGGYKKKYPKHWLNDAKGNNISKKNKHYGTLSSIYWIWKNHIKKLKSDDFIGISHYRRFWLKKNHEKTINLKNLKKNILYKIPETYKHYECFVCEAQDLKGYKFSKLFKKGKRSILKNPSIIFNKNKHTINLHFNMFHIYNGLEDAIELLHKEDKEDFLKYVRSETEFHPLSIFIIKKKYFDKLCLSTFNWLKKCEKIFNTEKLKTYGEVRIFDFLAERYFSFWIRKYCKFKTWPYKLINQNNKKI